MGIFNGKKKYWLLGACVGVLVLAGGLCAILLSGNDVTLTQAPLAKRNASSPAPTGVLATASIVVGTPEVDMVAEQRRQEMEAIIIRNTMLPGTIIYGVDVSGMSRDEAKVAVANRLAQDPLSINLLFTDGTNTFSASGKDIEEFASANATPIPEDDENDDAVDPEEAAEEEAAQLLEEADDETTPENTKPVGIELQFDVDKAVDVAFSLMRDLSLSYDDFMAQLKQISAGQEVGPAPDYDIASVERYVSFLAELLDVPPVNATIGMDTENNQLIYTDEVKGRGVDKTALIDSVLSTDPLSNETIEIPMQDLEPSITKEILQGKFTRRGTGYTTGFASSTKNRKYNIRFGTEKINGTILKPGDVFSMNEVLGKRTRKNGWKTATAYEGGEHVQQAGGGVCQLSSTLYNAVLLADLEVVERRNHSMPVSYVEKGRDATINSVGNIIDFKFRNNTSDDIIIMAYTKGNTLTMEIYGVPFETDEYDRIDIKTKRVSTTSIKTEYKYIDTKPTTYSKTISKGSTGYKVRTFKQFYKGNVLVKEIDLGLSVYTMFPKKVEVGTIVVETPPPNPPDDGNN